MDIRTVRNIVKITNTSDGRIVSDAFTIMHDESKIVDTRRLPESVLEDLSYFHENDKVSIELVEKKLLKQKDINIEKVHTSNGEDGTHEHTIFKPSDRAINVEEIISSGKSVEVGFAKIDAVEILNKHWKTIEKELTGINEIEKIKLLLSVAKELEITGKKYSIIEDRLRQL